jgi:hypothetical protein
LLVATAKGAMYLRKGNFLLRIRIKDCGNGYAMCFLIGDNFTNAQPVINQAFEIKPEDILFAEQLIINFADSFGQISVV